MYDDDGLPESLYLKTEGYTFNFDLFEFAESSTIPKTLYQRAWDTPRYLIFRCFVHHETDREFFWVFKDSINNIWDQDPGMGP